MLGGGIFACGGRASPNGMGMTDPAAVETGYCAEAYSLLWSATSVRYRIEPALRCYPASRRERCVQRSLPCVSSSGTGKLSVRAPWPWRAGRYSLERLLAKEDKNRSGPLWKSPRLSIRMNTGLRYGLSGNRVAAAATSRRTYERETASAATGGSRPWKTNPTLSRKINCIHCHCV